MEIVIKKIRTVFCWRNPWSVLSLQISFSNARSFREYRGRCRFAPAASTWLFRDEIIVGGNVLKDKMHTLGKYIDIGRAYETSKQQSQNIYSGTHTTEANVTRVTPK